MQFVLLINLRLLLQITKITTKNSSLLNIAEHENFSANKYENANNMPTIVGIFIYISRENFMLSCVKHEKRKCKDTGQNVRDHFAL